MQREAIEVVVVAVDEDEVKVEVVVTEMALSDLEVIEPIEETVGIVGTEEREPLTEVDEVAVVALTTHQLPSLMTLPSQLWVARESISDVSCLRRVQRKAVY